MPTIEISNGSYENSWLHFNVEIGDYVEEGNEIFQCNIKLDGEYIYPDAIMLVVNDREELSLSNGDEDIMDIGERYYDDEYTSLGGVFRLNDEQIIVEYANMGGDVETIYPFNITSIEYEGETYTEFNYE